LALALGLAAAAALISAWLTPRGPATTQQALASMVGASAAGLVCAFLMRSWWSMLLAPAGFTAVFELARLNTSGPTVDGITLGSTYGIIAFVVGRLVFAVLVLAPMVL